MPNITQQEGGLRIRFDEQDFLEGLKKQWANNVDFVIDGATFERAFNPFRFFGKACAGYLRAAVSGVSAITALVLRAVVNNGSTPYAYLITNGDQINRVDLSSTPAVSNAGNWPQAISTTKGGGTHAAHTGFVGVDTVLYKHNVTSTPTLSVFYSWNDGTDGDMGRYNIAGDSFDSDWQSTVPTGGAVLTKNPHPLIVGDDDILYEGDGNVLRYLDGATGADGTFGTALTLPVNQVINGFSKTPSFLVIYTYEASAINSSNFYQGLCHVYFWNYLDLDPTYSYIINDNYVASAFTWDNVIGCFTVGRSAEPGNSKSGVLRIFENGKFKAKAWLPGTDIPVNGGITVSDGMLTWNGAGAIYTYGDPYGGVPKLHKIGEGGGSSSGMLSELTTNSIFISSGSSSNTQLETSDGNFGATSYYQTPTIDMVLKEYGRWQIDKIKVAFAFTMTSGREFDLLLVEDSSDISGDTTKNVTVCQVTAITTDTMVQEFKANTSNVPFPPCSRFRLTLQWLTGAASADSPVVTFVDVFIRPKN